MKICTKCKIEKDFDEFHKHKRCKDGLANRCKECSSLDKKEYYDNNKSDVKDRVKKYRDDNIEVVNERVKNYYTKNKEELLEYKKNYHIVNKERKDELYKKWRENNREHINEYSKNYNKMRIKSDDLYKLKCTIRSLVLYSIKNRGYKKKDRTENILGCTMEEFKVYIEERFKEGMSWSNHGEWHLDHKTPVSWATNEDEVYELNHFKNFQPLWENENLSKGNRYKN